MEKSLMVVKNRELKKSEQETDKKIALEIVELFKSNNLNVMRMDNVVGQVSNMIKSQAHL